MDRNKLIRIGTDLVVGTIAAWVVRQMGLKQGTALAVLGTIMVHEMLDAPVAARLNEVL